MTLRRFYSFFIIAVLSGAFLIAGSACKSRKSICESNKTYSTKKVKKNKSNYGVKYGFKAKPVKKNYVIKNRR